MRKRQVAFLIFLLTVSIQAFAQDNSPKQKVQTIRRDVYSRILNLTPDESDRFWPVFDEMQAKLNEVKKKAKIERLNISENYNKLTDAQMEHALDNLLGYQQESLDIQKKYYQKFKKLIPIKKVALLPKAEREFKKELLKIIQGYKDSDE